jgi:hypothetical protein
MYTKIHIGKRKRGRKKPFKYWVKMNVKRQRSWKPREIQVVFFFALTSPFVVFFLIEKKIIIWEHNRGLKKHPPILNIISKRKTWARSNQAQHWSIWSGRKRESKRHRMFTLCRLEYYCRLSLLFLIQLHHIAASKFNLRVRHKEKKKEWFDEASKREHQQRRKKLLAGWKGYFYG